MINGKFSLIPAAYIILRKEGKVLLIRRANTGYLDGYYSLPSGHIDGHETAIQAAAREAKEEVGVTIQVKDLGFVHVIHRVAEEKDHERVDFFFEADTWEGEPTNCEPDKCDDLQWFFIDDLPVKTSPVVKQALHCVAEGKQYSDLGF
ncbi:MAG TPA: NUDIX domain-containing protein [Candidatus Saccharimonadales bacterium]|nr:NUDIX domain-containing protein [Candidatus Saccharimonadales bacterium]